MKESTEGRKDLDKYYDIVKYCSLCKKIYGSDLGDIENGICPVCREDCVKSEHLKKRLKGIRLPGGSI